MKLTTDGLCEMKKSIDANAGPIRAEVYFADTKGKVGHPIATSRDIHGVERELVIWLPTPDDRTPEDFISQKILAQLASGEFETY